MFTQVAGFLRFPESAEPLDNTRIHPETYDIVRKLMTKFNLHEISQREKLGKAAESVPDIAALAGELGCGVETLRMVAKELQFPALDPRSNLMYAGLFRRKVRSIDELKEGDKVLGIVRNVTTFGTFVDIGVGMDAVIRGTHFEINTGDVVEDLVIEKIDKQRVTLVPAEGREVKKKKMDKDDDRLAPRARPSDLDVIESKRRKLFSDDDGDSGENKASAGALGKLFSGIGERSKTTDKVKEPQGHASEKGPTAAPAKEAADLTFV
jgi:transcriptional accessory protein Tex/SPT6